MGLFTAKSGDILSFGLIGTDGTWDAVTQTYDIEWAVADIDYALQLLQGLGVNRGYIVVNEVYYLIVYLPPPPHLQQYEA